MFNHPVDITFRASGKKSLFESPMLDAAEILLPTDSKFYQQEVQKLKKQLESARKLVMNDYHTKVSLIKKMKLLQK